jgi:uncharacterized protein YcfJ
MALLRWMKEHVLGSPRVWITAAVLVAFAVGAAFEGFTKFGVTSASSSTPAPATAAAPASSPALTPASTPTSVTSGQPATRTVAASTTSAPQRRTHHKRPLEQEALIVGGSAGAGAAIGAAAGGGKGAGIGALSGGVAGLVYDLATRNK